jgi:hypothetical protein
MIIWNFIDFCKAVRVDMANSKKKSFDCIIPSTLSLITVLFEDVFDAVNIHNRVLIVIMHLTLSHPSH